MPTVSSQVFTAGGPLPADSPVYLSRQADRMLLEALLQGRFCHVSAPRQLGKSSLMIRTATRLRQAGVAVAMVDLTVLGRNNRIEQWYGDLLARLWHQLGQEGDPEAYWQGEGSSSPEARFLAVLQQGLLPRLNRPLVIFLDELELVKSVPFGSSRLLGRLRSGGAIGSKPAGLTFCLLGVSPLMSLEYAVDTTFFAPDARLELSDFSPQEAVSLAAGLHPDPSVGRRLLLEVLAWSNGHPYLTQRLCQAVASRLELRLERVGAGAAGPHLSAGMNLRRPGLPGLCLARQGIVGTMRTWRQTVQTAVRETFLTAQARTEEPNFEGVRHALAGFEARHPLALGEALAAYLMMIKGKNVPWTAGHPGFEALRLSGLVRCVAGQLRPRNAIYLEVFDREWTEERLNRLRGRASQG